MVSGPPKPSLTAPLRNARNRVRSMWDAESVRVSGVSRTEIAPALLVESPV